MARFARDSVDRVKEAADIVEIVSAYTDLRQRGKDYWGNCPFHEERTPSFKVNPQDKLYYCFGCEAGGDVLRFVQDKEGLSFPDAVESLAERYGVELEREREDPRAEAARRRRERLSEVLARTAEFYVTYFWDSPKAAKAREYLAGRKLGEEALRSFGVGFAPSAWDQVLTRGQRAGFTPDELRAAGLIQRGRQGGDYDRFRARITFPIRDQRGRVLGFGARAMSQSDRPKYLNSPDGELYKKGSTLFGIDVARAAIARARRAIVVEGYTDAIALHQAGIEEAVAVCGTAITPDQLAMLAGLTDLVVLALDADAAGQDAMVRAQRVAGDKQLELSIVEMPEGRDPADMLADGAADEFRKLIESAVDLPTHQVRTLLGRADLHSGTGRDRALAEVAPVLAALGESVSRDELIRFAADRLDTDPSLVSQRVALEADRAAGSEGGEAPAMTATNAGSPRERRERALFAMCVAEPGAGRGYLDRLTPEHLSSPLAERAHEWLRAHLEEPLAGLPREDTELVSLVTQIVMTAEREPSSADAMELNYLQLEQRRVEDQLAQARERGDDSRFNELSRGRAELVERIAHAERAGG